MKTFVKLVLCVLILSMMCAVVIGYGAEVFQGRVVSSTSRHELAMLLNASARTVDSNTNGIIDAADNCGSCSSGAGGAPQIIMMNGRWGGGFVDAGSSVVLGGATMPLQVLPAARTTHLSVRKVCMRMVAGQGPGPCTTAYARESDVEVVRMTIDWAQRTIQGYANGPEYYTPSGTKRIGWNIVNAQSNTDYAGTPDSGTCTVGTQCGTVELDIDARIIKKLPTGTQSLGGCGFIAVVSSYG